MIGLALLGVIQLSVYNRLCYWHQLVTFPFFSFTSTVHSHQEMWAGGIHFYTQSWHETCFGQADVCRNESSKIMKSVCLLDWLAPLFPPFLS